MVKCSMVVHYLGTWCGELTLVNNQMPIENPSFVHFCYGLRRKWKVRRVMDHDNDNLIGKAKLMTQAKGKNKVNEKQTLTTSHGHLLESRASAL